MKRRRQRTRYRSAGLLERGVLRAVAAPVVRAPWQRPIVVSGSASGWAADAAQAWATLVSNPSSPPEWLSTTRNSAGQYHTSGGLLASATTHTPRIHTVAGGSGLLVEPAGTNILEDSDSWPFGTGWSGGRSTFADDAVTGPDGATSAVLWSDDAAGGGDQQMSIRFTETFASAGTYTLSFYGKQPGTGDCVGLYMSFAGWTNGTTGNRAINFRDGSVGYSAGATPPANVETSLLGSGWYRASMEITIDAAALSSSSSLFFMAANTVGFPDTYIPRDGTSIIHVAGWQLEAGAGVTSPIATSGGSGSRAADVVTIDCTDEAVNVPNGDTLRFTDTDGATSDVVVAAGSATVPNSAWSAPWETVTRIAA